MNRTRTIFILIAALLALAIPSTAVAAGRPSATTGKATDLSPTSATVSGTLNPNGLVTTWYFQYGRNTKYGSRTPAQDAGSGTQVVPVSASLTDLKPNTTYHYRVVATNSAGSRLGADRTFKTPQEPTVSTIATAPNPATFGTPVFVSGFLVGPKGGGGKQVALEGNAFPYTAGFQQIGNTAITGADGGYQFLFTGFVNVQLRVTALADRSVVSPVVLQNVAIRTTLRASDRGRRGKARFSGRIYPARSASVVVIQKRTKRGGWSNVSSILPRTKSGATSSTFSKRVRTRTGVFRAVARPGDGAHVQGISSRKRVRNG